VAARIKKDRLVHSSLSCRCSSLFGTTDAPLSTILPA
jgi:hypothetical protein